MLEEFLGRNFVLIMNMLPLEIVIIVVIMLLLHKTGSLERMAKALNMWLRSMIDADKARKDFQQELEVLENDHDAKLETLQVEARLQSQASYALSEQRARQELFDLSKKHIKFLESEIIKQNEFMRQLVIDRGETDDIKRSDSRSIEPN